MNDLLLVRPSTYHSSQDLNLYVPKVSQITLGYKSFTVMAPKIRNSLATSIKVSETYKNFQLNIKLILPITYNSNLKGPNLEEGIYIWMMELYICDIIDIFDNSLDSTFLSVYMSIFILFTRICSLGR